MAELAMARWAMTASHHEWPAKPPQEPVAITRPADAGKQGRELTNQERDELRRALDRLARCSTGKLVHDEAFESCVLEQKSDCK
jgi:hypothetical protein